jgi:D-3-phosphoglycerate dehydrogenase / 2-oxoglutarate reductase
MEQHRLLFLTDRGALHQRQAARACPRELDLRILRNPTEAEAIEAIRDVEFLITERNQPVTRAMLLAAKKLALIVRLGSLDYDIDLGAARELGVPVVLQAVRTSIAAAEHVLMMILAVIKRLGRSLAFIADPHRPRVTPQPTQEDSFVYNFEDLQGVRSLYQRSVMILGMGEIGLELARRLRPFAPRAICYYKRHPLPSEVESAAGVIYCEPERALPDTEVFVSLLPYSSATAKSVGGAMFAAMPRGGVFIHAGSGGTIDQEALLFALESRHLAGAALDTFDEEPLPSDHPLAAYAKNVDSNLLLTPHVASGTEEIDRREDFAAIMRFLHGEAEWGM